MTLRAPFAIGFVFLCFACSSSSGDDANGESADPSAPAPDRQIAPPPDDNAAAPAPASDPAPAAAASTTDGGAAEGGNGSGTGTGTGTGAGTGGGKSCPAGSAIEKEGNDTVDLANPIAAATGTFCGTLSSGNDVDFASFTLPDDTTSLGFSDAFTRAGVTIQVTVDGKSFEIGEKPEILPGKKYVIKASTSGDAPAEYHFTVTIGK